MAQKTKRLAGNHETVRRMLSTLSAGADPVLRVLVCAASIGAASSNDTLLNDGTRTFFGL